MKKLLFLNIVSLLLCVLQSSSQPQNAPIRFTHFTIADGLPANIVNHLMQDSRGFLWFSTSQGLARFDGSRFLVYRHSSKDSNSMPFDDVKNCIELNNYTLLFVSGSRFWMLDMANGKQYAPTAFWQRKGFHQAFLLKENMLAIVMDDKTFIADQNLTILDSIQQPVPVNDGIFYLGENSILFADHKKVFPYSLTTKAMLEWQWKQKWNIQNQLFYVDEVDTLTKQIFMRFPGIGTSKVSYNNKDADYLKPTMLEEIVNHTDRKIFYKNGVKIIPNGNDLLIYQPNSPILKVKYIPDSKNSPLTINQNHMFKDGEGYYWSAGNLGISRFNLKQLNYQYWELPFPATTNHFTKHNDKIWMGDERNGSFYLNCITKRINVIDSSILQYCWGAAPVNNQIYIFGSSIKTLHPPFLSKLIIYNPQTKKIANPSFLNPFTKDKELVTLVYQAKNGDIWYSINQGGGLVRQTAGTNTFTQFNEANTPSFHFRYVNKAAEDKNGNIYFSVNKKSEILVWKNADRHFEEWRMDSIVKVKDIHFGPLLCLTIDAKQNLWISHQGVGLVKYNLKTGSTKLFIPEDGLPTNLFDNMVCDAHDNIWIPSPKGLFCLNASTDKFIGFNEGDGLPFTDFSGSYLFFDAADTTIYFSRKGFLYNVSTAELLARKMQSSVRLYIEALMVNNQPYYFSANTPISLPPGENNLQFTFTLLDLDQRSSGKNFEYLLTRNNEASKWQSLQGTNIVAFSRLNAGDYTLRVRMQDEFGSEYINGSNEFHFSIATEWYNTLWFKIIGVVLTGLIVWAFIRTYYLRKLAAQQALLDKQQALEAERTRIAADMHDDVGAGLSRIRYITSSIKDGKHISTADMDKIMNLSDESVEKMNEIIWSLNQGNRNLDEIIYHIRSQCATLAANANLTFICELPDKIPPAVLGWNEGRNMYMLAKEAVNNAVKHAEASSISLDFSFQNGFGMTIIDNGKGFDTELANREGNGLKNFEKRTAALNGTFSILSAKGNGTKVEFHFMLPPGKHT